MLRRSLFTYELLPVFRSARIAHFIYNSIFDEQNLSLDCRQFYKDLTSLFNSTLINEGRDTFRYSELIGTVKSNLISRRYLSGNYSIINKKPILEFIDKFWEIRGSRVFCKEDTRQEFSSISRDIHPFCFLSLHFYDMYKIGKLSTDFLKEIIDNIDSNAICSTDNPTHSENHLHLGGASPSENCILCAINQRKINQNWDLPNADRDMVLFDSPSVLFNIFGNCARYLFHKEIYDEDENEIIANLTKIRNYGQTSNRLFGECSLENMRLISNINPLIEEIITNSTKNGTSAFFYFLIFLWSKIFSDNPNHIESRLAFMLMHIVNILRGYSVMSSSTGLEFFTKYFRSPARIRDNENLTFFNIFNSGTQNLQYRVGFGKLKEQAENIIRQRDCFSEKNPNANIKINLIYHYGKASRRNSVSFEESKKRKEIQRICDELEKFAGSCESIDDNHRFKLKAYRNNIHKSAAILMEKNNGEKVDFMKFLAGIDAAGNEENVPPEVYAPYFRKLANLTNAREKRAIALKKYPELRPLRKAFHTGEDFEDIATGLRRIDETISFLDYRENDRISHALALGLDPIKWYSQKGDIRITKINLLDNLVWLCHQARKIQLDEMVAFIQRCEIYIAKFAKELYIKKDFDESDLTQKNLYEAWKLRRNCPIKWKSVLSCNSELSCGLFKDDIIPDINKKFDDKENNDESLISRLFIYYNTDRDFFKRANEYVEIRAENSIYKPQKNMRILRESDIKAIRTIQDYKINEYAQKGIIIESCPSSNIYIGGIECAEEHPIFRWNPPIKQWLSRKYNESKIRKNVIRVSVNTDDPAIFPTNLENEFSLLRNAAIKFMSPEDNIEEINEWIEKLKNFNRKIFEDNYQETTYQDPLKIY